MTDQRPDESQQINSELIQNQPTENLRLSSPKPDKKIIIGGIIVIVLALAAIGAGAYSWWQDAKSLTQKACTMEAKLCPDGSSVGRVGPNCEFAPCPSGGSEACKNLCGDGICQEVVCTAISCPCAETAQSCPQDCAKENGQINQVSITDILSNPDQYLDKRVQLEEKFCGWGQTTGSASPLFSRSDWCICQNPQKKAEQSLTVTGAALPVGVSPSESESIGEILSITGVVKKTSNNIPYIEAEKIVSEICEINKEYESTAVNSIKCQCPEGYKFQIISMGWGPCPEPGMSDCPASKQKCVPITTTEESCQTDSDCACGVKIDTRECFFGNKNYVDTKTQCPDFCTGIDGKIETKCVNNLCQQVHQ